MANENVQRRPQGAQALNAKAPKNNTKRRNFTGTKEIMTDLFKLMPADVIKHDSGATENAHPARHANEFTKWQHTHPFRTYDKSGKRLNYSVPIGGHFHVIEWAPPEEDGDAPEILSISGPMVMGMREDPETGIKEASPVPANKYDKHTHDIEYLRSSKIITSTSNTEAAAVVAMVESKVAPISGVVER